MCKRLGGKSYWNITLRLPFIPQMPSSSSHFYWRLLLRLHAVKTRWDGQGESSLTPGVRGTNESIEASCPQPDQCTKWDVLCREKRRLFHFPGIWGSQTLKNRIPFYSLLVCLHYEMSVLFSRERMVHGFPHSPGTWGFPTGSQNQLLVV